MNRNKLTSGLILFATALFITAGANAQTTPQQVNVTIRPAQTVEERVADEMKEKALRKAAEEKLAAEEAARIAETDPKALLRRARIILISSDTSFFEEIQLQNALQKREEFNTWQIAIIDDWQKRGSADLIIDIDRPLFTYDFTYKITNSRTGIVLATGKVTAFDGNAAAPKLAGRIIDEMRAARGEVKTKK